MLAAEDGLGYFGNVFYNTCFCVSSGADDMTFSDEADFNGFLTLTV